MADWSMFGPQESGANAAIGTLQNIQKLKMNDLAMEETVVKTEEMRENTAGARQQREMQAQQEQQRQAQQTALQKIAMETQGKDLKIKATALMDAGFIEQGGKILDQAAQIDERLWNAHQNEAKAEGEKLNNNLKAISTLGNAADNINSQEDYNKIVGVVEKSMGKPLPDQIRNAKWSPELKSALQGLAINAKDKAELAIKFANERSEEKRRESENSLDRVKAAKESAEAALANVRATKLRKADGETKAVITPAGDVKEVMDMIRNDYPKISKDDSGADMEARYVAGQAQALLAKNRALTRGEAIQQAYNAAKQNGDITEKKETHWFGEDTPNGKASFKPGSKAESKPAEKAPSTIPEGSTATGKDGKKIILKDGKWQPVQ